MYGKAKAEQDDGPLPKVFLLDKPLGQYVSKILDNLSTLFQ